MENIKNKESLFSFKKPFAKFNKIILYVNKLLYKKYFVSKSLYDRFIIRNLIYDERNKLVSTFKEHLIMNDTSEFMRRYYSYKESLIRLEKYYEFYSKYSKLFPNYIPLSESKYIYKNIHKKQKIIDMQQNKISFKKKDYKTRNSKPNNNKIFNSEVYESIVKNSQNFISDLFYTYYQEIDENNNDSISQIINIINSIDKYELEFQNEYQYQYQYHNNNKKFKFYSKYNKELKNKNIIINNYYYNNSSILTKQSTIPSVLAQQQKNYTNEKIFSILNNNFLIGLKKKKNKQNYKNNYNNSTTFKNFIHKLLINNNNDKNINKKKQKCINESNYSLFNSFKNNKSISNNINGSINYLNNNKSNSSNKNKKSNIFNNNIHKYIKAMPNTARIYVSQNKKIIDEMNKININVNSNYIKKNSIKKKTSNNSLSGNIKKKKKKKLNFTLINRIILNKTNCLSDRTSHFFEDIKNNIKIKKHLHSGNIKIKKFSNNNTSRNNINNDNNKSKNYTKINKNKFVLSKKKYRKIEGTIKNTLLGLKKKNNLKHLTCKFLNSNLKINNTNIVKTISNKKIINNLNIKTERDHPKKKNSNELGMNQIIKIKSFFHEKLEKNRKNNTGIKHFDNYKFINKLKSNKQKFNKSDLFVKSKIENSIIDFKNNLFSNMKEKIIKNCYYTIENSIDNSYIGKDFNRKINSSEKITNSNNNINNINNQNEKNNYYNIDTNNNHNKKSSVIKIKGIKIKNFNKILNINKEKSNSNSSKKNSKLNSKNKNYLSKIPKNNNYEKKTHRRILDDKNNIIKIKTSQIKKKNSFTYNFPQSLTEREKSKKSKNSRILK